MSEGFILPDEKKGLVTVKVNSHIFPIDLVYTAAYLLMDRAYVILDGSPQETVYAILKPRMFKGDLEELGRLFYDQLVSSAFHTVQLVRNKELRDALVNSAIVGDAAPDAPVVAPAAPADFVDEEEEDISDIAMLWEDKFGQTEGATNEGSCEEGE